MLWLKRIASGCLLGFGVLLLVIGMYAFQDQSTPKEERTSIGWTFLVLGMLPTAGGGWIAWGLRQQKQQQEREHHDQESERLRSVFFQTLQLDNTITPLQFAMAADISGAEAKAFLDEQAKEFTANFDVNEQGEICYRFNAKF